MYGLRMGLSISEILLIMAHAPFSIRLQVTLSLRPNSFSVTALSISFKHYPVIANWLSFSFELAVLCCIWKAPTNLAGKALCAFMALLHPNGGENYIVPLTAFWHATLLVPLALLWKKEADHLRHRWIRSIFIVLGGLSSPVIIPLSPL